MLNSFEIKKYLKDLGFQHFIDNVRIDGFSHQDLDWPVYIKTAENKKLSPTKDAPIVFHIQYEAEIRQLILENIGVSAGANFYFFNSNMSGFEKKLNNGKKPTQFGIHLDVSNKQALEKLLLTLSNAKNDNTIFEDRISEISFTSATDQIVLQAIKTRRGQPEFRQGLLAAFNSTCCVSGCKVIAVLEAAHIVPHGEETNYSVYNGLLLRADIHTLFDLGLMKITDFGHVKIDKSLKDSEYFQYDGVKILSGSLPEQLVNNLRERIHLTT